MLAEILMRVVDVEAARTRSVLERVPAGKAEWKPHERSMALGRIAGHVAELAWFGQVIVETDELDFAKPVGYERFVASDGAAAVAHFDATVQAFREALRGASDEHLQQPWVFRRGENVIYRGPRVDAINSWAINHATHHRGQLTVYLRLLDVPLPGIFGPTADEQRMG